MSKTLLGVAYILLSIPYVNILGMFLVPIGWVVEGRARKRGLWTATGVVGLISVILVIAGIASILGVLFSAMGAEPSPMYGPGMEGISNLETLISHVGIVSLGLIAVGLIMGVVYFFMMLVSLFQAGGFYRSTLIKVGAVLYVLVLVLMIASVAMIAVGETAAHEALGAMTGAAFIVIIGAAIMNFLAGILAGIGFLVAKEPVPQPTYHEVVPPPPPPPPG